MFSYEKYELIVCFCLCVTEYDTDEETDELLDKQYNRNEQIDIPELSKPPVNRSAQVSLTTYSRVLPSSILHLNILFLKLYTTFELSFFQIHQALVFWSEQFFVPVPLLLAFR